ncbi:hypothetical protein [Metabacillus litoralis]|uniref:hypothetical protein n=1 Tax=Metabacillus litoralis TaxID=152268 RepID=UPI00203C9E00|nr:hypothetical protein [Metabacillus litoralis]MCM3411881.1 hypothetical protein [Metabacillus litoralis]
MARYADDVENLAGHLTKADKEARGEAQEEVNKMANEYPTPTPTAMLNKEEQLIFENYAKYSDRFREQDSTALTMLAKNVYKYDLLSITLDGMYDEDPSNPECGAIERRLQAIEKQIVQHLTKLRLTLGDRQQLANEIAKEKVELKKLAQLEAENKPAANPVEGLWEDDEDE